MVLLQSEAEILIEIEAETRFAPRVSYDEEGYIINLSLFGNKIVEFPKSICKLKKLKSINLGRTGILEIPAEIGNLSELWQLQLDKNGLTQIPSGVNFAISLTHLNLKENEITEIKNIDRLSLLENLQLRANKIEKIEGLDGLQKLMNLNLSNNHISQMENLENLENLEYLDLKFNSIIEIGNLQNLQKLKTLELSWNKIIDISNLEMLQTLNYLDLRGNQINKIKGVSSLKKLRILYLAQNSISEIEGLESLLHLEILNLNQNAINSISGLSENTSLKFLDLNNNKIRKIEGLNELINLSMLNLYSNPFSYKDSLLLSKPSQKIVEHCCLDTHEETITKYYTYLREKGINDSQKKYLLKSIGTYREGMHDINEIKKIQNVLFINEPVEIIEKFKEIISPTKRNPFLLSFRKVQKKVAPKLPIFLYLIQLNQLLRSNTRFFKKKKDHYRTFCKKYWDMTDIKLEYKSNVREFISNNISGYVEMILREKIEGDHFKLVIFPECCLIDGIQKIFEKITIKHQNLMIIGGMEHVRDFKSEKYINEAIITFRGKSDSQIKQTPVFIHDKTEAIELVEFPKIKIFDSPLGRIAIFICKDYLRLHDAIPDWIRRNQVELVIIPSHTASVLPFYYRLLQIIHTYNEQKFHIIFTNVGEFGGSDAMSIQDKYAIERNFQMKIQDNVGEAIIKRKIVW